METIKIEVNEMHAFLKELQEFTVESPIGYPRGRTIVSLERKKKTIRDIVNEHIMEVVKQYGEKDEKEATGYKMKDTVVPDPQTGRPVKIRDYDFGDKQHLVDKAIADINKYNYQKNEDGSPIMIEVEVHKVSEELAKEFFEKNKSFTGLAYTLEYLFPPQK